MSELHVQCLEFAKKHIQDPENQQYICNAIKTHILHSAVNSPLHRAGMQIVEQISLGESKKTLRSRLAWIDVMIEYWANK